MDGAPGDDDRIARDAQVQIAVTQNDRILRRKHLVELASNEQRSGLIDRISDDGKLLYAVHVPADLADHNLDVVAYVPRLLTQSFAAAERLVVEQFRSVREGRFDDRRFATAFREGLKARC